MPISNPPAPNAGFSARRRVSAEEALRAVYGDHASYQRFFHMALRMTFKSCPEERKDCAQTALDRLCTYLSKLSQDQDCDVVALLRKFVRGACWTQVRRGRRHPMLPLGDAVQPGRDGSPKDPADVLPDPKASDPERSAIAKDQLRLLWRRLSRWHGTILIMIDYLKLEYEEAAEALGLKQGTLKREVWEARRAARKILADS